MAFAGVDITGNNPFDLAPGTINTANSNTATATSITTVSAGAAVIMLTQEVGSGRSWSNWSATNLGTLTEIADARKVVMLLLVRRGKSAILLQPQAMAQLLFPAASKTALY